MSTELNYEIMKISAQPDAWTLKTENNYRFFSITSHATHQKLSIAMTTFVVSMLPGALSSHLIIKSCPRVSEARKVIGTE